MQLKLKVPLPLERWLFEAAAFVLLLLLYVPLLIHWCDGWLRKTISTEHEYFSHGLIGLPFAAFIVWSNRNAWKKLPTTSHPLGFFLLLVGAVFYLSPVVDLVNLSLPIVLAAICLVLKGIPGLKLQAFPLILVLLASPNDIPYLIAPYTLPLQQTIAGTVGFVLGSLGMKIVVQDIYLFVGGRVVEVAPYCAGLKMMFTSLYVSLMLLYWRDDLHSRQRIGALLLGSIGVSIVANVIRNGLLTFFHGTGNERAFETLHAGWGGDLYSACMLGMLIPLLLQIEKWFPDPVLKPSPSEVSEAKDLD